VTRARLGWANYDPGDWDIATGVVGGFAIFGMVYGVVSLVKRLVGGALSSWGGMWGKVANAEAQKF
jgi:hypothetical protein